MTDTYFFHFTMPRCPELHHFIHPEVSLLRWRRGAEHPALLQPDLHSETGLELSQVAGITWPWCSSFPSLRDADRYRGGSCLLVEQRMRWGPLNSLSV